MAKRKKVGVDVVFLCVGPTCWGKGNSEKAAVKAAKDNGTMFKSYGIYLAPKDVYVNGMGSIEWADGNEPCILLKRVVDGKEQDVSLPQIGDNAKLRIEMKALSRRPATNAQVILPAGTVGWLEERDDDGQFYFYCETARTHVSPVEIELI